MRSTIIILLVCMLALTIVYTSPPEASTVNQPSAQYSSSTATAWDSLVRAYSTVKAAESDGSSPQAVFRLTGELNVALGYYENSTTYQAENNSTLADQYATLSASQSSNVTTEAIALDATAKTQTMQREEITYTSAFIAAILSSAAITEVDRLGNLARRNKDRDKTS